MARLITLTFLFSSISLNLFGQVKKSEKQLKSYLKQINRVNVDTILIIKSGCTGCDVVYNDTPGSVIDGQSISVLTKHNGKYKLATFDDIHELTEITVDTCSFFDLVSQSKQALKQKDKFYKN